ncbi:MAG: hydantoinase/oxoprolinase family protein, partial [Desulfosarcinaceae bacterium]
LNAAVYPVHKAFFEAVQDSLAKRGLNVPIRLLKPDGGNMNFNASMDYPAQTILSGPAASVMGGIAHAPKDKTCLLMDIGGTTTDMAIMVDDVPLLAPEGIEIGTYKTSIRALLTHSIGVGGDSAVRVAGGRLTIGPDRIGRAMAYGGPEPTPTDAFCILGMAEKGDQAKARQGLAPIAQALGVGVEEAARMVFDATCEQIMVAADAMVERINSRPVYTVHEMADGLRVQPNHILILGGPAPQFAKGLQERFKGTVGVVPHWEVANAIGCALARTTCEVSVFADTAQHMVTAPGEHFSRDIAFDFDLEQARGLAKDLLREKARRRGANLDYLQMEIIEENRFNMIRGFRTVGRNIRVRAQVKPGLIHGFDPESYRLVREDL